MKTAVTAILIGAGQRGSEVFGAYALANPSELHFVAVAEPRENRRKRFAEMHRLEPKECYEKWEGLLAQDKMADVAFIATPDHLHVEPTLAALEKGYDVLLEKPMATTPKDCIRLVNKAEELRRRLQIGHVLRYSQFYSTIYDTLQAGRIGRIVNISMRENVSYWHYAHSFIRGNWHNREKANPMILAKCCHDLDLLHWFVGAKASKISSFGFLTHFGSHNAPEGAPERCTDGCPAAEDCLYNAVHFYTKTIPLHKNMWPASVITLDQSLEGRMKALKEGPYGKCVHRVEDHNVVDHQVVSVEFENEVTATLTMHGHSPQEGRTIRIDGTKGTIIGEFLSRRNKLVMYDSLSGDKIDLFESVIQAVHGGGDIGLMNSFIKLIRSADPSIAITSARESLESHLMAFAADEARLENRLVDMNEFRKMNKS